MWHSSLTLILCLTALPHLIVPRIGEARDLWGASPCPYANSGSTLVPPSSFLGLLDPKGLSQVLSSDLPALDFFHYSTREPSPFAIMEPFTHHPTCNTEDTIRLEVTWTQKDWLLWLFLYNQQRGYKPELCLNPPSSVLSRRFKTSAISIESSSGSWDEYDWIHCTCGESDKNHTQFEFTCSRLYVEDCIDWLCLTCLVGASRHKACASVRSESTRPS